MISQHVYIPVSILVCRRIKLYDMHSTSTVGYVVATKHYDCLLYNEALWIPSGEKYHSGRRERLLPGDLSVYGEKEVMLTSHA